MYCGDNEGTDIDHYEPLALAPLLTFAWLNHLLACSTCNSHHKRDFFPLDDSGAALLLDPTVDDPFEHMVLSLATGRYAPRTDRGRVTIAVCGLNRDLLTRGRQNAYDTITFMLPAWHEYFRAGEHSRVDSVVRTIREQPFADVVQAMQRYAHSPGATEVFADRAEILPLLRQDALSGPAGRVMAVAPPLTPAWIRNPVHPARARSRGETVSTRTRCGWFMRMRHHSLNIRKNAEKISDPPWGKPVVVH